MKNLASYKKFYPLALASIISLSAIIYINVNGSIQSYVVEDGVEAFDGATLAKGKSLKNVDIYGSGKFEKTKSSGAVNIYGAFSANDATFEDINVYGSVHMTKVQLQDLNAYGSAKFQDLKAHDISVYGHLNGQKINISGELMVYGKAEINKGQVKALGLMGDSLTLENTYCDEVKISCKNATPKVFLKEKSHIQKITFEENAGKVILMSANATAPSVINGKIVKDYK